jgi:hypothetical protein
MAVANRATIRRCWCTCAMYLTASLTAFKETASTLPDPTNLSCFLASVKLCIVLLLYRFVCAVNQQSELYRTPNGQALWIFLDKGTKEFWPRSIVQGTTYSQTDTTHTPSIAHRPNICPYKARQTVKHSLNHKAKLVSNAL